jgi:hypothetical protein
MGFGAAATVLPSVPISLRWSAATPSGAGNVLKLAPVVWANDSSTFNVNLPMEVVVLN